MPYCHGCGDRLSEDYRYCRYCQRRTRSDVDDARTLVDDTADDLTQASRKPSTANDSKKRTNVSSKTPKLEQALPTAAAKIKAIGTSNHDLAKAIFNPTQVPRFTNVETDPQSGFLKASINRDSVQCYACSEWFSNTDAYDKHRKWYPIHCSIHKACMPADNAYVHAQTYKHVRCFVPWCNSKYRHQTNWDTAEVKSHVWKEHYPKSGKR